MTIAMLLKQFDYFFHIISDAYVRIHEISIDICKEDISIRQETISSHGEEQSTSAKKRLMVVSEPPGFTHCMEQLWQQLTLASRPLEKRPWM